MTPVISWHGVDYYEAQIRTENQFNAAAKLYEGWFQHWGAGDDHRYATVKQLLSRWLNDESYGLPQAWLLFSHAPSDPHSYPSTPYSRLAYARCHPLGSFPADKLQYHALLLSLAHEDADDPLVSGSGVIPPESFCVSVEALCRDPWASASVCASWAIGRSLSLSDELGGAREIRIPASEFDLAFQKSLKSLNFYCYGQAQAPLTFPHLKGKGRYKYLSFAKILKLRTRQSLPFPTSQSHDDNWLQKRRRENSGDLPS